MVVAVARWDGMGWNMSNIIIPRGRSGTRARKRTCQLFQIVHTVLHLSMYAFVIILSELPIKFISVYSVILIHNQL